MNHNPLQTLKEHIRQEVEEISFDDDNLIAFNLVGFDTPGNPLWYEVEVYHVDRVYTKHIFHFAISNDELYYWVNLEKVDDSGGVQYREFSRIFFEYPVDQGNFEVLNLFHNWLVGTVNSLLSGNQD